ncbi:MAG: hypothetical protein KDE27_31000 [Planctomycetes bacterium]|nr:hypothetical protein [Planctomycetota bacterium]
MNTDRFDRLTRVLGLLACGALAAACAVPEGSPIVDYDWEHGPKHTERQGRALRVDQVEALRTGPRVLVELQARIVEVEEIWQEYVRTNRHPRRWRGLLARERPVTVSRFAAEKRPGCDIVPRGIPLGLVPTETIERGQDIVESLSVRWSVDEPTLGGNNAPVGYAVLDRSGLVKIEVDDVACRDLARIRSAVIRFNLSIENVPIRSVRFEVPAAPFALAKTAAEGRP